MRNVRAVDANLTLFAVKKKAVNHWGTPVYPPIKPLSGEDLQ